MPTIITRRGKQVAVVVSIDDFLRYRQEQAELRAQANRNLSEDRSDEVD